MNRWIERASKNPSIMLISLTVAIIGLVVMIVLFFVSQTSRELVYVVNPVKTSVVTKGQATELKIMHKGVDLGDVDITAAQVAIWNSGEESIRKENILKDIIIRTDPPVPILEVSIVKCLRDADITGFSILESPKLLETGKLPVSWRILEKNDGASIQLIYLGSTDVHIIVEGLIEDSGEVKSVGTDVSIKSPYEQVKSERRSKWFFVGLTFFYSLASFFGAYIFFEDTKKWKERIFPILLTIFGVGTLGVCVWFIINKIPPVPPFGL